jgi:hypothetical protein
LGRKEQGEIYDGHRVFSGAMKKFQIYVVELFAQFCEYTKIHQIACF